MSDVEKSSNAPMILMIAILIIYPILFTGLFHLDAHSNGRATLFDCQPLCEEHGYEYETLKDNYCKCSAGFNKTSQDFEYVWIEWDGE